MIWEQNQAESTTVCELHQLMQGASLELVHVADVVAGFFQIKKK